MISSPPAAPSIEKAKSNHRETVKAWKKVVAEFEVPDASKAIWQLVNSVGGLLALWVVMYFTVQVSWLATLLLALLGGGLMVRIFIIFHDCGHGSFFKSRKANHFWGFVTGIFTFTPFHHWRWEHSVHHAGSGHLDRRGMGDVWTMTVDEYLAAPKTERLKYRLLRHPLILFTVGPFYKFVIRERFTTQGANARDKKSVHLMNLAVVAFCGVGIAIFGFWPWFIIQMTIMGVGCPAGIWLFYVQHQYEDTYWEEAATWDYTAAALEGSSFYKLPKVLQWFSGNIGFHHIHHLSSRIPNYNLERCHNSHSMFNDIKPMTMLSSLKCLTYRLWDKDAKRLIGFGQLKRQLAAAS